jgi:cell fate regulator YaaT (PSP1 superfamily)
MPIVVGVAFKPVGKISWYDPGDLDVKPYDGVIAETANGPEFGWIKLPRRAIVNGEAPDPLLKVLRLATVDDFARHERLQQRMVDAMKVCREKVAALDLPMKVIEAEWAFNESQVTFHFVAEGRVDFRELVRDVAGVLRTRVMLHQVGPRDHAKVVQGIGPCGRPTCCSTFLREFEPVSMKMAKVQNLALNPSKFSGLCGKLMCCLRYEYGGGEDRPNLPEIGMVVMTPMGRAKVEEVNALHQMATVQLETQQFVEVRLKDLGEVPGCVDHAEGGCSDCASSGVLDSCEVPTRDRGAMVQTLPMV